MKVTVFAATAILLLATPAAFANEEAPANEPDETTAEALEEAPAEVANNDTEVRELQERMSRTETRVSEQLEAMAKASAESLRSMEAVLAKLGESMSKAPAAQPAQPSAAPAPAPVPAPRGGCNVDTNYLVNSTIGLTDEPVTTTDDVSFTVSRRWICMALLDATLRNKAPRITVASKGGLVVRGIGPNSPFKPLGIKNGDRLLMLGETELVSTQDLSDSILRSGSELNLMVMRRNKEMQLNYSLKD